MAWNVGVESTGFKAPYLQPAKTQLALTKASLAWAAITVGRPDKAAVKANSHWSINEALFRWHLVLANLDLPHGGGSPSHSPAFHALDPSEKGGVNFFLGMMMAKLVAQKQLQVPWLHHFDNFKMNNTFNTNAGKSKPDFVGLRPTDGSWHIIEAKARCAGRLQSALDQAKGQAQMVLLVNGAAPATHIGTLLYKARNRLRFKWDDPDGADDGFELKEGPEVWREYYRLPWALHSLSGEDRTMFERISGLRVSIDPEVEQAVEQLVDGANGSDWRRRRDMLIKWSAVRSRALSASEKVEVPQQFLASDGVAISLNGEAEL